MDLLESYPGIGLGRFDYAACVGLILNRNRVLYRRALAVCVGASFALGGEPPRGFFAAITDTEEQAKLAAIQAAAIRQSKQKKK